MSEFALKVQDYYNRKLWSLDRVKKALSLGVITQSEYDTITLI